MSLKFKLVKEDQEEGNYHRVVDFKAGSGGWTPFLPAWRHDRQFSEDTYGGHEPIAETYVKLTLDKLREIDSEGALQRQYILEHLKPVDGVLSLPLIRLCMKEGQTVSSEDIRYLSCLFPPPPYLAATIPFLFYYKEKMNEQGKPVPNLREAALEPVPSSFYLDFVEKFMDQVGSSYTGDLAMVVPPLFKASEVPRLLKAYRDHGAPLGILDSFGSSTYELYPVLRALRGTGAKGKSYSFPELYGEDHAFYAFDTKPYVGMKPEVAATHLIQTMGGYSSFGPRRSVKSFPFKKPGVPPQPQKPPRVLVPNEISYSRADVEGATDPITRWAESVAPQVRKPWLDYYLRSRFAAEGEVKIAMNMREWAIEGHLSQRLNKKGLISKELARVRKGNRRLLGP